MIIDDDLMDLLVPVVGVAFWILFMAFVFIKSFIDNKKDTEILTEIYQKYGVKTNAKILSCTEHKTYGRTIPAKYIYFIKFQYNSTKIGTVTTVYNLPTNHRGSKAYTDEIPIIYIPAFLEYDSQLISREELFRSIGHKFNCFGPRSYLILFEEDLNTFTNLVEL